MATGIAAGADAAGVGGSEKSVAGVASRLAEFRSHLLVDLSALDRGPVGLGAGEALAIAEEVELLTRALAAVSATVQVAFRQARVEADLAGGVAPSRAGRTAADDLALARRTSPYWGSRDLSCSRALLAELPHTLKALTAGTINAYQARVIAEVTSCLEPQDRSLVDHRLEDRLEGASNKEIEAAVRALVYEVDPAGYVQRARRAAKDRGVSIRPAPDVMATLTAHLPAPQAIACYTALRGFATAARASGDPRSVNQLMADELFHRLTGRHVVDGIDIELCIVITDTTLFEGTSEPADLKGFGPIPADLARDLLRHQTRDGSDNHGGAPTPEEPDDTDDDAGGHENAPDDTAPDAAGGDDAQGMRRTVRAAGPELCPDGAACTSGACTRLHGQPTEHTPRPGPSGPSDDAAATGRAGPADSSGPGAAQSQPAATGSGTASDLAAQAGLLRAARVWARRLFTDPATGILNDLDPRRRLFTGNVRRLIIARDQYCRTPWCGAPIRDVDHKHRHRDGGRTTPEDGQGTCGRCNQTRERPTHTPRDADLYLDPPPLLPTLPTTTRRRTPPRRSTDNTDDGDGEAA